MAKQSAQVTIGQASDETLVIIKLAVRVRNNRVSDSMEDQIGTVDGVVDVSWETQKIVHARLSQRAVTKLKGESVVKAILGAISVPQEGKTQFKHI